MAIYKLAPQEGKESHKDWRASSIPPMAVWVRAESGEQARARVQAAFVAAYEAIEGEKISYSPWVQPELTRCDVDRKRDPGPGIILREDGKTETTDL
jgi:hypothetical protein